VLATLRLHGTVSPGGVPLEYRVIHMHGFRNGAVDRIRALADREQAIAADN
jgi:hypothetical protein